MAPKNHKKGKKTGDDKNIEANKDIEMEVKSSKDQVPDQSQVADQQDQPEEIEAASAPHGAVKESSWKEAEDYIQ
ncbi:hypothetical protein ACET3Z_000830 [Daucus carota]